MHCSFFLFFVHVNKRFFCVDHYRLWLNKRAKKLCSFCVRKNHQLISKMCHILDFSEQSTVGINWIWFLNKFIIGEQWACVCFCVWREEIQLTKNGLGAEFSWAFPPFSCVLYESGVTSCQVTWKRCLTCFGESVGGRGDIRQCEMGWSFCNHEDAAETTSLCPVTKQAADGSSDQGEEPPSCYFAMFEKNSLLAGFLLLTLIMIVFIVLHIDHEFWQKK